MGLASCKSQTNLVVIEIHNRSSKPIDSIVVQKKSVLNIAPGKTTHILGDLTKESVSGKGAFPLDIYQNGKRFPARWGFHDWGVVFSAKDSIYLYDHGLSFNGQPLQMPPTLSLFFSLCKSQHIDSIYSLNNSIMKIRESSPLHREVVYNYKLLREKPVFLMRMEGKEYRKDLRSHDFENWNNAQDFLTFANGEFNVEASNCDQEFIVDLVIRTDDRPESITTSSTALTKAYNEEKPRSKRFVFDYKKLKQNPVFVIQVNGKELSKDLSSYLSNPYAYQKIFTLTSGGIVVIGD